jgi:hypothetical protein
LDADVPAGTRPVSRHLPLGDVAPHDRRLVECELAAPEGERAASGRDDVATPVGPWAERQWDQDAIARYERFDRGVALGSRSSADVVHDAESALGPCRGAQPIRVDHVRQERPQDVLQSLAGILVLEQEPCWSSSSRSSAPPPLAAATEVARRRIEDGEIDGCGRHAHVTAPYDVRVPARSSRAMRQKLSRRRSSRSGILATRVRASTADRR